MDGGFTQLLRNEVSYSNLYTFCQRPFLLSVQFLKNFLYFIRTSSTIFVILVPVYFSYQYATNMIFKNYISGKLVKFISEYIS